MYDALRSDRSVSSNALEARVPYLDKSFLNFMLNLNPKLEDPKFNNMIEKYILRKAFDNDENPYLPKDVL